MPGNESPERIYKFGDFELLVDQRMLMRANQRVQLTPRVFHLLVILVDNAGKLVTKESLLSEIWQDSFVEEGNLNATVSRLRKILGEKPDERRFIETIPRVGYRFTSNVEVVTDRGNIEKPSRSKSDTGVRDGRKRWLRWLIVSIVAILIVAGIFSVWLRGGRRLTNIAQLEKQKNVPVRLTDDPNDEGRPSLTKDGHIRFHNFLRRVPYSFIMNSDGSDAHREISIPGMSVGLWSPDEKKVIYYKEGDESGALFLANSDGSGEKQLPFLAGNMDWSPDGSKVVYQYGRGNSDIYLYTLDTGKIETLVDDPAFDSDPSFSPDGRRIAFISGRDGNQEIYVEDIDGSNLQRLTTHPARDAFPTFSPDGTQIVFNSNREGESMDVYIMNADGSDPRRLTNWNTDEEIRPGCWSPDGTQILFVSGQSGRDNIYAMSIEPFAPRELLTDVATNLQYPTYSADGTKMLFRSITDDGSGEFRLMDTNTKRVTTLRKLQPSEGNARLSPDGNWIVYQDRINDNSEVCLIRSDGTGEIKNLTNNPARDGGPSWSPDGSKIVFVSNRDGNYDLTQLYIMNEDGSNQHRIYYSNAISAYATWSPDGKHIAFANDKEDDRTGNFEIFTIEPETTEPERRLTFRRQYDVSPAYSPDGNRIAFTSHSDGNWEIYMMNADGSRQIRLTRDIADDGDPTWSPDGKRIIFTSLRGGRAAIYEMTVE
jgi:Tol biopolymer transport system component/DNA-binding winged helix-turn-helix (wHTH) protein